MRAFAFDRYKQPLHEIEVAEPRVGDHDVLIQIQAAGVNQLDEKIRLGAFKQILPYDLPLVLGHDLAGVVLQVGSRVKGFAAGDAVFSRPRDHRIGTFAERIAVHENDLAHAPTTVSPVAAASLPLVSLTAWQALVEMGNVQPGQKVLIHAGAGGVGAIAIQLAKHLGAYVATTVSERNAELVRSLGADEVIDYRTESFETTISGYDLVLDSLGARSVEKSLEVLKPGGKVIGISGPPTPSFAIAAGLSPILRFAITALSRKIRAQAKRSGVSYEFLLMQASGNQLAQVAALVDAGKIRPIVGATFPFSETDEALSALARGDISGKVVITMGEL